MTTHSEYYDRQVQLLLKVMPIVAEQKFFALKGGTAINLFHLNFPRYSVDIDLTYLPIKNRADTYKEINQGLRNIKDEISKKLKFQVTATNNLSEMEVNKLTVKDRAVSIKIEPNYILRGSLFDPVEAKICDTALTRYNKDMTITMLAPVDLYAGKICAALDRSSPRDLFDIHHFYKTNTISEKLKDAFIYYMLSGNRPFYEMLEPSGKAIVEHYDTKFKGMAFDPITLKELKSAFNRLTNDINASLSMKDKEFLISIANNKPDWSLYKYPKVQEFPSIKWKLINVDKMSIQKRYQQTQKLEQVFSNGSGLSL